MSEEQRPRNLCFKRKSAANAPEGVQKPVSKSLKQILAIEKSLLWPEDAATYSSLNAPPSLLPAKKYSDISGLIAPYTDPHTKLRYHNAEEYEIVKSLPSDITAGYLSLRGASSILLGGSYISHLSEAILIVSVKDDNRRKLAKIVFSDKK